MTIVKLVGTNRPITIECPLGWTTPAGSQTDFELPGVRAGLGTWIVLWDVPAKLIVLISAGGSGGSGSAFPSGGGAQINAPQTFLGGATYDVRNFTGPIVQCNCVAGNIHFGNANLLTEDIAVTISKITNIGVFGIVADAPALWTVNGVGASLILPGSDTANIGAWLYYTDIAGHAINVRPAV
jgi:hypothetical protein